MRILFLLFLSLSLLACDKKGSMDSTKQRAQAEQEAGKDVDNRNLQEKATKMEADLTARHEFYSALAGTYEGDVNVDNEIYKIKLILSKSLAPYTGERIRQLSEIENDILNLYLNIQIVQWHPEDPNTGVGCRISGIKPDLERGVVTVTAVDCPNTYSIYLAEEGTKSLEDKEGRAEKVAHQVKEKALRFVSSFVGTIQPSSNAKTYTFVVNRVD